MGKPELAEARFANSIEFTPVQDNYLADDILRFRCNKVYKRYIRNELTCQDSIKHLLDLTILMKIYLFREHFHKTRSEWRALPGPSCQSL